MVAAGAENVAVIPRSHFDELEKAKRNQEYQAKLDRAFAEYHRGEPGVSISWEEMEAMEHE